MRKRTNALSVLLAPVALGAFFFLFFPIAFATEKSAAVAAASIVVRKLPRGAAVNGVNVGEKTEREAREILYAVEEKNVPSLTVETPTGNYVYSYPEIGFLVDFSSIFERAQRNGKYEIAPRCCRG